MQELCDLHTHSNYSDGTCTPEELVLKAKECGLQAIALTDHNTITGLPSFLKAAKEHHFEAIPGIEFSTHFENKEYHIVALFIKEEYYDQITQMVKKFDDLKEESNLDLVKKLSQIGMVIDYERLKSSTPNGRLNRANIANELVKKGYVESMDAAFKTVLSKDYGLYVEPSRLDTLSTIKFIKDIGAVSILAHPLLQHDESDLNKLLPLAIENGLNGIETIYSTFTDAETEYAKFLAKKYHLLQSGGSDFHGENKPDTMLGVGKGNLKIPYKFLQDLKQKTI
ncbi:MAG: PHP domain-containing protein [Clostridia bacterium]|nr:PHP domain-containing protein [Clostridia bacterium]